MVTFQIEFKFISFYKAGSYKLWLGVNINLMQKKVEHLERKILDKLYLNKKVINYAFMKKKGTETTEVTEKNDPIYNRPQPNKTAVSRTTVENSTNSPCNRDIKTKQQG